MGKRQRTNLHVIHCSATPPSHDIGAKEIDRWHREKGWLGIGYHFVIRRDGTLEKGRDLDTVGAHIVGHNSYSIGTCLVGGVDKSGRPDNNFTEAQWRTLEKHCDWVNKMFPGIRTEGHGAISRDRACPSFNVQEWVRKRASSSGPIPIPTQEQVFPVLRRGSLGTHVRLVQSKIGGLIVDGIFGPLTEEAVRAFQEKNDLLVDGIVGPNTWKALVSK